MLIYHLLTRGTYYVIHGFDSYEVISINISNTHLFKYSLCVSSTHSLVGIILFKYKMVCIK